MAQYIVIGNGVAAVNCIEGIRSVDKKSPITVVSEENYPAYCRPLISYYLEGKAKLENMPYRADNFYEKHDCTVLYGKKATQIDPEHRRVLLNDGAALPYTAVCIATGAEPFVPAFQGLEKVEKKFTFLTLDDTLRLEKAIDKNSRVLIVGAGLIGLKCAEGICERVAHITVCDLAPRVLSSILDDECAGMMQKRLEENGIEFMLGDTVAAFEEQSATMLSDRKVDFDVLVLAVGVKANVSLVADAGGAVKRGILVDKQMQTTLKDVYAAGDCTEGDDISLGKKRILAILPNASMQGRCAGVNMAGGKETFEQAIPMNSIGFFGLHAMTAGSYFTQADGGELYEEKIDGSLKRLFSRDGYLTGFILIGNTTDRAGIYTSLIRERTPLDMIDYDLLKKVSTTAAFPAEIRGKKFGGVV